MDCGPILAEVVKGLFSAQVIFGGLILYFLLKYRQAIGAILERRLSSVSFPGGVKFDMAYPPIPDTAPTHTALPKPTEKAPEQLSGNGGISDNLEGIFRQFLLEGIRVYRNLINTDIDLMYKRLTSGPGYLLSGAPIVEGREEKFEAIKERYNVAIRAVRDYYEIKDKSDTAPTSSLVTTYNKAVALHEYLFRHNDTHF